MDANLYLVPNISTSIDIASTAENNISKVETDLYSPHVHYVHGQKGAFIGAYAAHIP